MYTRPLLGFGEHCINQVAVLHKLLHRRCSSPTYPVAQTHLETMAASATAQVVRPCEIGLGSHT